MTLTNVYASEDDLRASLGVDASATIFSPLRVEMALNAASRQIDTHCGRRFWQDAAVTAREYRAEASAYLEVDDISTAIGVVVKLDTAADGTFATTLTVGTHYVLEPLNAQDATPYRPYDTVCIVDGVTTFPRWSNGRPGVQVTAKYGWLAVPDAVRLACVLQAAQLVKASDAPFGVLQLTALDGAPVRVGTSIHPQAAALLEGYARPRVG